MGVEVEFQKALVARLNGASIGATAYDVAQQGTSLPYVTAGRIVMSELDTQTKTGDAALVRIHTFSDTGSMLEAKTIQGAIYTALHKAELTVTGFSNYSMLREDTDCFDEQDGKIHGVCEYRALIESA